MNLITLWDINNNVINLSQYGLIGIKLIIASPSYKKNTDTATGRPGIIDLGKDLNPRKITAKFIYEGTDYDDSLLLRDELFNLFSDKFYIGEARQPGKRWLVELDEEFEPERLNFIANSFEMKLEAGKGVAESVGTTLSPFEWDADLWQWGQGVQYDDYSYDQNTNAFTIFNAGSVVIDPRYMDLTITINATTSDYIELVNLTTNETFRYDGTLLSSDNLVIDGIRSTKNDLSVFRDTNKQLITLLPGSNDFQVNGATVERILFDTRFYYL